MTRKGERGQTMVEFALVFPVFLLLLFGVLDFGRVVYAYNTISNAAREGARAAVILDNTPDQVKTTVVQKAVSLSLTTANVNVTSRAVGQPVTVTVDYRFTPIVTAIVDAMGASGIDLHASSTMYVEGDDPNIN